MQKVITRYPPSPTGELHIGNIRSLLFNYLYARQHDGEIVMRFEDTDLERSKKEYEGTILRDLEILGLTFDHGPFRQSERTERYQEVIKEFIEKGLAYEGEESNDGSGKVIRFKNPNKEITFRDEVRGDITIDTTDFGDFVIARSMQNPLYHLTVVVDDIDGGITHVIRGEDHITSTPRQILMIEALGGVVPAYAHLPLIVGEDKKKLGKRHGAVTLSEFGKLGYLPEAVVNQLALLGWNPGDEREIFTLDELVSEFSLEKVQKGAATFSYQKLDDINKQHMSRLSQEKLREYIIAFLPDDYAVWFTEHKELSDKIIADVITERISKFWDVGDMATDGELEYFFIRPQIDKDLVTFKDESLEQAQEHVKTLVAKLEGVSDIDWNKEYLKDFLWDWTGEVGRGSVLHPMRTTLSGQKQSPDPFTLAGILGKDETMARLQALLES